MSLPEGFLSLEDWARSVGATRDTASRWCRSGLVAGAEKHVVTRTQASWVVPADAPRPTFERRRGTGPRPTSPGFLPAPPLVDWIRSNGWSDIDVAREVGIKARAVFNLRFQRGVTEAKADTIVTAMGAHITEVYPDYFELQEAWA